MEKEWVREIKVQCKKAKVPFFFKQWGGVQKSRNGRELDGRTWDEMPMESSARAGRRAEGTPLRLTVLPDVNTQKGS